MSMRIPVVVGILGLLAAPALAQAVPSMQTSTTAGEKAAATYFTEDSVGDVQLGRLGLAKARDAAVRALAQAMVRDHTRTAYAGLEVARAIGDDEAQFKAGDDNQIALTRLARYTGARFDREYVSTLVDAHKADIAAAEDTLDFATTPVLREYLRTSIAIDKRHLAMAEAAQAKVGTEH